MSIIDDYLAGGRCPGCAALEAQVKERDGCLAAVRGALHLALGGEGPIPTDWVKALQQLVRQRDALATLRDQYAARIRELEEAFHAALKYEP